ncbi:MAG TPA: Fur family transcriptional regulator [Clostridia bacterium]|nr:Fur family transcriptional regulator [Clostridia bacterium]
MSKMTVPEIKKHLANHNIRASLPRVKIYDYLVTYESHPTVDEIYNALVDELVTLSKTTVYNTMDLFAENDVVIELLIEKNEIRYDADIMHHGHFKCIKCGDVFDFDYNLSNADHDALNGCELKEYHAYIKGVCENCNPKKH